MDLLGIGPLELILIILIALIVVGPRDIGKTARSMGKFLNRLYKSEEWKSLTQASRTLRTLPQRLAREAELEELDSIRNSLKETAQELQTTGDEVAANTNVALRSDLSDENARNEAMRSWSKTDKSKKDPPTTLPDKP